MAFAFSMEVTDSVELGLSASQRGRDDLEQGDSGTRPESAPPDVINIPDKDREQCELPQDTYTMLFLSNDWKVTALAVTVFVFKVALYSLLLADDLGQQEANLYQRRLVVAAQALLLPVAVAMQQDLTNSLVLIANTKYSKALTTRLPGATHLSYTIAMALRLIDGILSLVLNVIVLFHATGVLSMFLNFAALHFLQSIDDIVHDMCQRGFVGGQIQATAKLCNGFCLPARRDSHWQRSVDSVGYILLLSLLVIAWIWFIVYPRL